MGSWQVVSTAHGGQQVVPVPAAVALTGPPHTGPAATGRGRTT